MARPEHSGFESPVRSSGGYPKGTTFKKNPDGTLGEAIIPDGYVKKIAEDGSFYYEKEGEDGKS